MPKITTVRTLRLAERPKLLWTEIETDDGLVGLGETFRGAETAETAMHELLAPGLIGRDASEIEGIAAEFQNPYVGYHSAGAEIRAASALDIALWDLAGQRHNVPIYEILGGISRASIPVYNTCAGYDFNTKQGDRRQIADADLVAGPYDDQIAFMRDAGTLAERLLSEGYSAMKIWPFDQFATHTAHNHLSGAQIREGLRPFEEIRARVGDRIDIMCELHSLFDTSTALAICQALEPYAVRWVEDPISKMDDSAVLQTSGAGPGFLSAPVKHCRGSSPTAICSLPMPSIMSCWTLSGAAALPARARSRPWPRPMRGRLPPMTARGQYPSGRAFISPFMRLPPYIRRSSALRCPAGTARPWMRCQGLSAAGLFHRWALDLASD